MEKSYTLKEAAELLGLTKAGVRFRLNALSIPLSRDGRGRIVVPDSVFQMLCGGSKPESGPESEVESGKCFPESDVEFSKKTESKAESDRKAESKVESAEAVALAVLREQIAVKDAQIASLTAQLSDVTEALKSAQKALEGAQALHAATVKQLQEATTEPVTVDEDPGEPEQKKRSLFDWLKRGK